MHSRSYSLKSIAMSLKETCTTLLGIIGSYDLKVWSMSPISLIDFGIQNVNCAIDALCWSIDILSLFWSQDGSVPWVLHMAMFPKGVSGLTRIFRHNFKEVIVKCICRNPPFSFLSRMPKASHVKAGQSDMNLRQIWPPRGGPWGASWDTCSPLPSKRFEVACLEWPGQASESFGQRNGPEHHMRMVVLVVTEFRCELFCRSAPCNWWHGISMVLRKSKMNSDKNDSILKFNQFLSSVHCFLSQGRI